ncbi:peptidoglycan-associated lipoprotein Pal [Caldimonas aquatica]|uniref:Peptidoglycan-associated lipoprotein n=1 Tax=Caldimonas aquatica TaxID=376175 RepID=A0ABY6MSF5_9BURK|nr:peptidoglycan-associated lipoprotein Pal [Schlegelella aquatica]UZD54946.1 peptidoglycan-associated lipoprotein Pal [Schlegelella aquatica]
MNRSRSLIATLLATAFVLGGCASTQLDQPAAAPTSTGSAGATAAPQSQVTTVNTGNAAATGQAAENLARAIYFDFDSAVIKAEHQPTLSGYAKLLSNSEQRKLTIEGHTDERGSIEYNLALGQRRAESVRKALALLGVKDAQMKAVSYGEERPAVDGHDEEAWSKNRRAEFKLR